MNQIDQTPELKDLWSTSSDYRTHCQAPDEIETIVRLLTLDGVAALADVGCGNGAFSLAAARSYPKCKVFAFDALASAIEAYKAQAADLGEDRVMAGVAWAHSVPLETQSVERVLCRAVLHHIPQPHAAYAEMARILKPGGLLLLQAPCDYWDEPWSEIISEIYMLGDDSHRRYYHQPGRIVTALSNAGLAMLHAACWTYSMCDLDARQVEFIQRRGAQDRLRLRQQGASGWTIDLYWVRVIAEKL